jgi:nuclear transport factor 2 (NTF2) superfamily protein
LTTRLRSPTRLSRSLLGRNSGDPARVALGYSVDCLWRNRADFTNGRTEIEDFLTRKWNLELDYRLIKELWTFRDNRIGTRQPS